MFEVMSSPRNLLFTGLFCSRPLSLIELLAEMLFELLAELLDEPEYELLEDELDVELLDVLLVVSFSFACLELFDPPFDPILDPSLKPLVEPLFVLLPFSVLPQTVRLVDHERSSFQS